MSDVGKLATQRYREGYAMGTEAVLEKVDLILMRMRRTITQSLEFQQVFDELDSLRDQFKSRAES